MSFEDVIRTVEEYIDQQHTYFVLESLESLRKNGRLTGMKAIVATVLSIKPIMGSTPEGMIRQLGQGRGIKKALRKMVDIIAEETQNAPEKVVAISHCNCPERAKEVLQMLTEKLKIKGSVILDTRGVSSLYANDGGIIVVL